MIREPTAIDLRPFNPEHDYSLAVDLITAVNIHDRSQDWYPTVEGLVIEWDPRPAFDPERDAIFAELDGRFVAGGTVEWHERAGKVIHSISIWVRPEVRRQGLGSRILAWLESRARTSVRDGAGGTASQPHFLGGGIDVEKQAGVAFANRAGYQPIRYGFQMRRPLDQPIPAVPLPEGLEVRPVLPEHHRTIWEADVEAFRDHFEPRERDEVDFAHLMADPDCDPSIWQVAWDGSEVAGSVLTWIYRHENATTGVEMGWLDHVSVRRQWRGQGLAKALIARSMELLRDKGMTVAVLGVDAENPTGALQLYEGFGFQPHRRWATVRKPM